MKVFIGVDPHKLSVTVEVVDVRETVLATGRFRTDGTGYAAMRKQEDASDLAAAKARARWLGLVDPGPAMGLHRRQPAMAGPCGTTPHRSGPGWGRPRVSSDGGL